MLRLYSLFAAFSVGNVIFTCRWRITVGMAACSKYHRWPGAVVLAASSGGASTAVLRVVKEPLTSWGRTAHVGAVPALLRSTTTLLISASEPGGATTKLPSVAKAVKLVPSSWLVPRLRMYPLR